MSFEKPQFDAHVNQKNELDRERAYSAEDQAAIEAKYPTVESIVDDYRMGYIDLSAVSSRFPEKEDMERVESIADERNAADAEKLQDA